ncbi:MAG: diaminopimelate decarboxylase [Clostridiales Family XIII bacterium]|nr:diaminopimelate decarboxylase [Clostridiales Family XIII bacterium]
MFDVKDGVLYIEDVSAVELAERFGTPLYVYSRGAIAARCREIREDFLERWPGRAAAAYAGKAFLTPEMARIIEREGLMLDVVSGGEFFTALKAGFPAGRIKFHGNNKTKAELEEAIGRGVGHIVVDGTDELDLIEEICGRLGKRQPALFRIAPEVEAATHDHITTGKRDSKFGVPMDEHILYPLIGRAIASESVIFEGLHFHIGSQLFDNAPYLEAMERTLDVVLEIHRRFGSAVPMIAVGGGFGIRYTAGEERRPYLYFLDPLMRQVETFCAAHGLKAPAVGIEPGRSIVGEAGVTLYRAGAIKDIPGAVKYVSVDGGMSDNIRPALYGAEYEAVIANKAGQTASDRVTVCGKLCETGDRIVDGALLAEASRGDVLCVFATGAYCYAMASNYNKIPKAAVVLVDGADASVIVRRQSYEEMIACEM